MVVLAGRHTPTAHYNLGFMYDNGLGVAKDKVAALHWFKSAAELGDSQACFTIGVAYANGDNNLKQDNVAARDWFTRASEQGHTSAQYSLGVLFAVGNGVPVDKVQAAKWYQRSARNGHPAAQYALSALYMGGEGGLPQDKKEGEKWCLLAGKGVPPTTSPSTLRWFLIQIA